MLEKIVQLKRAWLLILLIGFGFTLTSIFIPARVNSRADAASLKFGHPFAFITQDQSGLATPSRYWVMPPYEPAPINSFDKYPTTFSTPLLLLDLIINSVIVGLALSLITKTFTDP